MRIRRRTGVVGGLLVQARPMASSRCGALRSVMDRLPGRVWSRIMDPVTAKVWDRCGAVVYWQLRQGGRA